MGMPLELMEEDLEASTREAMEYLEEEEEREVMDLGGQRRERGRRENTMSDGDLACLQRKFPFLADLSDRFVRSQTTGELLKMEATAMKLKMMEQSRDYEDYRFVYIATSKTYYRCRFYESIFNCRITSKVR